MYDEYLTDSQIGLLRSASSVKEPDICLELAAERELYLSDENCITCSRKFNIPGISHSKKLYCNFCYRGVCMNCLSFESFHSESHQYEKMCPKCYHMLSMKSQKFQHELQLYQLERAELWKEIKLACQQREMLVKERQIAADELENLKKTTSLVGDRKDQQLEDLKSKNKGLIEKVQRANEVLLDGDERKEMLMDKFLRNKKDLEKEKRRMEEELRLAAGIKSEINALAPRLAIMRKMKAREIYIEEDVFEKIEEFKNEIQKLEEILDEKLRMNSDVSEILTELDQQKAKNEEIIKEIEQRLLGIKNDDEEEPTESENSRLEDLKEQIKQLDDLIRMLKERKNKSLVRIDSNPEPNIDTSVLSTLSGLKSTIKNSTASRMDEQKSCCTVC